MGSRHFYKTVRYTKRKHTKRAFRHIIFVLFCFVFGEFSQRQRHGMHWHLYTRYLPPPLATHHTLYNRWDNHFAHTGPVSSADRWLCDLPLLVPYVDPPNPQHLHFTLPATHTALRVPCLSKKRKEKKKKTLGRIERF